MSSARNNDQNQPLQREYDVLYKFLLIGDSGVGKSSLQSRFVDDSFTISPIKADFKVRTLTDAAGKCIKIQAWDDQGTHHTRNAYYRGAHGILVVFDMTDRESFANIKAWLTEVDRFAAENVAIILVGTKSDLPEDQWRVSKKDAQSFADKHNIPLVLTSSKVSADNPASRVDEAFTTLCQEVSKNQRKTIEVKTQSPASPVVNLSQPETSGRRQTIVNILLLPWSILTAIGRGLITVGRVILQAFRGIASVFHRSPSSAAQQPPPAAHRPINASSSGIPNSFRAVAVAPPAAAIHPPQGVVVANANSKSDDKKLEELKNQAKLTTEIAEHKLRAAQAETAIALANEATAKAERDTAIARKDKAKAERDAAIANQEKEEAERNAAIANQEKDGISAKALREITDREREEKTRSREENDIGIVDPKEQNNSDKPIGPGPEQ